MTRVARIAVAFVTGCALMLTTGCATPDADAPNGPGSPGPAGRVDPAGVPVVASEQAGIYSAVLRTYLTTSDHSLGDDHRFPVAYVLDVADPAAADPMVVAGGAGVPIPAADQAAILEALADVGRVEFVSDRSSVIVETDGCATVRGDGVLIVLGPPVAVADDQVEVPIHGFIACLGATWFTYLVEPDGPAGWRTAGTTGPHAIA